MVEYSAPPSSRTGRTRSVDISTSGTGCHAAALAQSPCTRRPQMLCAKAAREATLFVSTKEKEMALNEIRILASLDCEYIVKYKDCFYDDMSSCLCIVMEFANSGDLANKISS